MRAFSKKYNVVVFVVMLISVLSWVILFNHTVDRASAATIDAYQMGAPFGSGGFSTVSPLSGDFRIDNSNKTVNVPVSVIPVNTNYLSNTAIWPGINISIAKLVGVAGGDACINVATPPGPGPILITSSFNFSVDSGSCQSLVSNTALTFTSYFKLSGLWTEYTWIGNPKTVGSGDSAYDTCNPDEGGPGGSLYSDGPNGRGCYTTANYSVTADVAVNATLHPRAALIGVQNPEFIFYTSPLLNLGITSSFPTDPKFTVDNVGDKLTTLNWSVTKLNAAATWYRFNLLTGGDSIKILTTGEKNQTQPTYYGVSPNFDSSSLTTDAYVPGGIYTDKIRINDAGSTDDSTTPPTSRPAENSPQDINVRLYTLPPGQAVKTSPTGSGFYYFPFVINTATELGQPAISDFTFTANFAASSTIYTARFTFQYSGQCYATTDGSNTWNYDYNYAGPGGRITIFTQLPIYCPNSTGLYTGAITFTSEGASARIPYTITVVNDPIKTFTKEATSVAFDSVRLNGRVVANSPVWVGFQYSKKPFDPIVSNNFGTRSLLQYIANPGLGTDFSQDLSNSLDADSWYYFRAIAYPGDLDLSKVSYGSTFAFKTLSLSLLPVALTCDQNCNFTTFTGNPSFSSSLLVNAPRPYGRCLEYEGSTCKRRSTQSVSILISMASNPNWLTPGTPQCIQTETNFYCQARDPDCIDNLAIGAICAQGNIEDGLINYSVPLIINPTSLDAGSYPDRLTANVTVVIKQTGIPTVTREYSRSIPTNLTVARRYEITQSIWDIFKKLLISSPYLAYDYDNDSFLTEDDSKIMSRVIVGLQACPANKVCDLNNDGQETISDLIILQRIVTSSDNRPLTNTCSGKCNYTASGLLASDYKASLKVIDFINQFAVVAKNFTVESGVPSVTSVTVTQPDYCYSGPAALVSWTYSDPEGQPQSAYQVQVDDVASASWNPPLTIDSGKQVGSGTSYFTNNGIPPWFWNTAYKARVRVWNSQDTVSNWKESTPWTTPKHAYPSVDFKWLPLEPQAGQAVQFTDLTQFFDGGGTHVWNWLFGDGGSSTLQNPKHAYSTTSSYNVTETVTDKDGYSCSRTRPLGMQRPTPIWKEVSPK